MPKSRQFVKESTRKKQLTRAASTPQTADDYLAVGVEMEEAGEKWRAGDAAKSARFFVRAIDAYDEALKTYPDSFDLAYNKARVQYELTQYPKLAAQLPNSLLDLLKTTLESSRYALNLSQDNADILFNTAQVLISLVEASTEDRSGSIPKEDGLQLLEEAIGLFQRCLVLQEYQFESQAREELVVKTPEPDEVLSPDIQRPSGAQSSNAADGDEVDSTSSVDERWATIIQPVTHNSILDTVLAQLVALCTLCSLITENEGRGLAWIEEYSTGLLNKLPVYVLGTDRAAEASLTRANCILRLADASFRCQRIDAATYGRALEDAFEPLNLSNDPEGLCDKAEALIAYSSALNVNATSAASSKWKALTDALDALTAASKLPSGDNLANIHIMRGDVELLRYQLGLAPMMFETAVKYAATLLKNAGTYYRGAEGLGITAKLEDEVKEAVIKGALAARLGGNGEKLAELMKTEPEASNKVLEEAVDDGLVGIEWLIKEGIVTA